MPNAIIDASGNIVFTGGGGSGQITKGVSPNQVPASALGTNYVQPGYTGIAPPPWVNPVANPDSISGGVVSQARIIAAAIFLANDTVDSRSTLTVQSVQSPIGCTVLLNAATQEITMTPTQVTPVSFTYTVTDTQGNTSTTTATFPSVAPAVVTGNPPVPDLGPGLDASNSTLLQVTNTGVDQTFNLTAGTDYRVQFMAPITARVWLVGGRKVHVGWGPTPSDYGGQISVAVDNTSCLFVEGMSQSCWIEGMACLKNGTIGHCFQIRAAANPFPVYILNCFASGCVPVNVDGGGSALVVHDGVCPKITVDGFTFITYGQGIAGAPSTGGSITELVCNHVYGHWGVNAARLNGVLYELPTTASLTDCWAVDDGNTANALTNLVVGTPSSIDGSGNLIYSTANRQGQISKGVSSNEFALAKVGTNYVQPGYVALDTTSGGGGGGGGGGNGRTYLGAPFGYVALDNTRMTSNSFKASQRVGAPIAGNIVAVSWFCVARTASTQGTSYGWGDGGIIRTSLWRNDPSTTGGHIADHPSTQIGGSTNYSDLVHPRTNWNSDNFLFWRDVLPQPCSVSAGEIIHIVHQNVHSDAANNFCSTDDMNPGQLTTGQVSPVVPDKYNRALRLLSGVWTVHATYWYQPIYQLLYSDGSAYGMGWHDGCHLSTDTQGDITTTSWIRQFMTPSFNCVGVSAGLNAQVVSTGGNLVMTVRNAAGTTLGTPLSWSTSERSSSNYGDWTSEKSFASPISFTAGQRYSITFTATGSAHFQCNHALADIAPVNWGTQANFNPACSPDISINGRAEFSTNSGGTWTGWHQYSGTNRDDLDLPFYIRLQ